MVKNRMHIYDTLTAVQLLCFATGAIGGVGFFIFHGGIGTGRCSMIVFGLLFLGIAILTFWQWRVHAKKLRTQIKVVTATPLEKHQMEKEDK